MEGEEWARLFLSTSILTIVSHLSLQEHSIRIRVFNYRILLRNLTEKRKKRQKFHRIGIVHLNYSGTIQKLYLSMKSRLFSLMRCRGLTIKNPNFCLPLNGFGTIGSPQDQIWFSQCVDLLQHGWTKRQQIIKAACLIGTHAGCIYCLFNYVMLKHSCTARKFNGQGMIQ